MTIKKGRYCDYCNEVIEKDRQRWELKTFNKGSEIHERVEDVCYDCYHSKKFKKH